MHDQRPDSKGRAGATARAADAQRLIDELREQCREWLRAPLERGLAHFGKRLYQLAQSSTNHYDQQSYLKTQELLQRQREAFDRRFIESIDAAFQRLGADAANPHAGSPSSLSLLDTMTQDLDASLDQLVARSKVRSGPQLLELGFRIAVLLETAPLESDALPVGPQAMARAFRDASATLNMPAAHELLLLQSLENSLIDHLASLHQLINQHLADAGILPGLRPFTVTRKSERKRETNHVFQVPDSAAAAGTAQPAPDERSMAAASGDATTPDAHLQAALAALQEHFWQIDERKRFELNRPEPLRQELLLQLNVRRSRQAGRVDLSESQDFTFKMIVRLFARIAQQLPQTRDAQSLLYDVQLPMLRIALLDPTFFDQHEHPARQVLGRIAEVACDWMDASKGIPEHDLRNELGRLIEATSLANPGTSDYSALLEDIDHHVERLQHATQDTEDQQVHAMKGLERLENARQQVAALIENRLAHSPQQRDPLAPLHHVWSDVLALTLLRNGEDSATFEKRLNATDRLLGNLPLGDVDALHDIVEEGLRQVGMPINEAMQVAHEMLKISREEHALHAPVARQDQATDESLPTADHADAAHTQVSGSADAPIHPKVLRIHRHLRTLPAGVWFEFKGPAGQPSIRRRLAWYSPLTGHSLFVTRSGQRAQELGELKLAQAIVSGHISEIEDVHEDVLDEAWRAIAGKLRGGPSGNRHGDTA